jgi:bisphosphoglycerate-dependent phosphoglycerate mutase
MNKLIFFFSLLLFSFSFANAQNTEIWIVRHAEKDITDENKKDPNLSDEGRIRAGDLATYLKKQKFDVGFTTPLKRTRQTIDSLIIPKVIEYSAIPALVEMIKKDYIGKTIIIAGHSNTVLPIIEALGGKKPKDDLTEDDYDYIFRLNINGNKTKVKMAHFGRPHHL